MATLAVLLLAGLSGCGQKGPLTLPKALPKAQAPAAPDSVAAPAK